MLRKLILALVAGFILFVAGGLLLPSTASVERTIVIDRPQSTVFALLDGYRNFSAWSPWARRDPDMVYEFSGPETGAGATLEWSGDPRLVGSGWQRIVRAEPHRLIEMEIDFEQQRAASARFELAPVSGGTRVRWVFVSDLVAGENFLTGILNRYFGLLFDHWIGRDYEEGLAGLKSLAETIPNADFSDLEVERVRMHPVDIVYVVTESSRPGAVPVDTADAYRELTAFIQQVALTVAAQPMSITRDLGEPGFEVMAAIPVQGEAPDAERGNVRFGRTPAGPAIRAIHHGSHATLIDTYKKLAAWMAVNGIVEGGATWEQYVSDPGTTLEEDMVTYVYHLAEASP